MVFDIGMSLSLFSLKEHDLKSAAVKKEGEEHQLHLVNHNLLSLNAES